MVIDPPYEKFFLMIYSILIGVLLFIRTILFSGTKGISGKDTALLNPKYQDAVRL